MSFDSTCRRLAEQFPQDFASWILGKQVSLTILDPTELSLEPIRADSLILLQGDDEILHIEFQVDPKKVVPFRLADYRLRLHRKLPQLTIRQIVIYLRQTNSPRVYQDTFEIAGMRAEFEIIRIWEVPAEELLKFRGLLPFAALGKTDDPEQTLRDSVQAMKLIPDENQLHEALGAAYILSGLRLKPEVISQIIRRDVMQESTTYQVILEEGRQEGRQEERNEIAINLLREGSTVAFIAKISGLSVETIAQLKRKNSL